MDALTWFKSVFQRERATSASLHADVATEPWAEVPLHLAAARLRPPPAPADDDEDWDAVIARAKMEATPPPSLPPPLPREISPEMQLTPPPAPRARAPELTQATLDALVRGGMKKPPTLRPAFTARRAAAKELATPPPLGKQAAEPLFRPSKWP